ncbi:MAG: restriction endonuclease subunit S [Verrucomicrobia bacterium]|nr:restriction endonuclease subunit S [Verrucomicrobiota bacterium]
MSNWNKTPFAKLLVDSKDGEWGNGEETVGSRESIIIRGTDFADLDNPAAEFPRRWIKNHIADRKRLQPGDIILETAGGTSTQSTGRSALLKQSFFNHHSDIPVLCASFSRHLRLDREKYSPRFIYYLLQTLHRSGYMSVFNIQHTGVSRFQYTAFKNHTELQIPELPTQRKVAAILSAYDELIENNQRRIALLEKLAEEIYREWFVRLRFPSHEKAKKVKGIPQGWRVAELKELASINPSSISRRDKPESILYVDISSVSTNRIDEVTPYASADAPGRARRRVKHGDVIWSSVRPANRAYCLIYDPPENLIVSTGFAVIRPNPATPCSFLFFAVTSNPFVDQMTTVAKGSAYPATSFDDFEKAKLLVPTDDLLTSFHEKAEPLFRQRHLLKQQSERLKQTRDLLLPRLISGKLSVENLDIQFPPGMAEESASAKASADKPARLADEMEVGKRILPCSVGK